MLRAGVASKLRNGLKAYHNIKRKIGGVSAAFKIPSGAGKLTRDETYSLQALVKKRECKALPLILVYIMPNLLALWAYRPFAYRNFEKFFFSKSIGCQLCFLLSRWPVSRLP